jgi:hypothetical protein
LRQQQVLTDILHAPAASPCARRTCVPLTVTLPLNFAVFLPMTIMTTLAAEWATVVMESRYYPWVGGLLFTLPVWRSPTQKLRAFAGAGDAIATRRLLRRHAAPAATAAAAERGAAAAAAAAPPPGAAAGAAGAFRGAARSDGRRSSVRRGCRRVCGCVPLAFACAGGAISYAVSVALVPSVALLDALCGTLPRAVAQARHGDGLGGGGALLPGGLPTALLVALPRALLHAAFATILALLGNLRCGVLPTR